MEVLLENIVIYGAVFLIGLFTVIFYLRSQRKSSKIVDEKIKIENNK